MVVARFFRTTENRFAESGHVTLLTMSDELAIDYVIRFAAFVVRIEHIHLETVIVTTLRHKCEGFT